MPHPNGGKGNQIKLTHTFQDAFTAVGQNGLLFNSTTGEQITTKASVAADGITNILVFTGQKNPVGNVMCGLLGISKELLRHTNRSMC